MAPSIVHDSPETLAGILPLECSVAPKHSRSTLHVYSHQLSRGAHDSSDEASGNTWRHLRKKAARVK